MRTLLLYFVSKKSLIASVKSLGDKLRKERKEKQQWYKLAMNSLETLREIEQSVTDSRAKHRERAELYLYGE